MMISLVILANDESELTMIMSQTNGAAVNLQGGTELMLNLATATLY